MLCKITMTDRVRVPHFVIPGKGGAKFDGPGDSIELELDNMRRYEIAALGFDVEEVKVPKAEATPKTKTKK